MSEPKLSPFEDPVILEDVARVFRRARARRLEREAREAEQRKEDAA